MNLKTYKNLQVGDKVKLLVPLESNSGSQKHPAGTVLKIHDKTTRVRKSRGMPIFFWNAVVPGTEVYPCPLLTGLTRPEEIELYR
jgi:hypothetical protein